MFGKKLNQKEMNKLIVIVGPTCTGKTSLAKKLSTRINGEIISADSRQMVKGLDYGTGKLKKSGGVPDTIFGYDLVNPDESFSAFDYRNLVEKKLSELFSSDITPILVGGTGFYVDAVTGRVKINSGSTNTLLRESLNSKPIGDLQNQLKNLSSEIYNSIDTKNKVRVVRSIEKLLLPVSSTSLTKEIPRSEYECLYIGLTSSRESLYKRSDTWLDENWKLILKETDELLRSKYSNSHYLSGLVYKTAKNVILGYIDSDTGLSQAKFDTHAYIRRQQTWFKRNTGIIWFDVDADYYTSCEQVVLSFLGK